ncbi:MAG: hypothetical protein ACE5SW_09750 [Nitrososphaeraceae archaeon]
MNIYTIVLVVVIFIVFLGLSSNVYAKEYVNEEYDIKFEYPDEWGLTKTNETVSFFGEYDRILLANFYPVPDPNISNFVSLTIYTNITNPDNFLKIVRNELNTDDLDEKGDTEILNIKKYKNIRGDSTLLIKTIYTPKLIGLPEDVDSSHDERTYMFFHEDRIGYKIIYSLPLDIAYKYQDDVFSIVQQIRDNKR